MRNRPKDLMSGRAGGTSAGPVFTSFQPEIRRVPTEEVQGSRYEQANAQDVVVQGECWVYGNNFEFMFGSANVGLRAITEALYAWYYVNAGPGASVTIRFHTPGGIVRKAGSADTSSLMTERRRLISCSEPLAIMTIDKYANPTVFNPVLQVGAIALPGPVLARYDKLGSSQLSSGDTLALAGLPTPFILNVCVTPSSGALSDSGGLHLLSPIYLGLVNSAGSTARYLVGELQSKCEGNAPHRSSVAVLSDAVNFGSAMDVSIWTPDNEEPTDSGAFPYTSITVVAYSIAYSRVVPLDGGLIGSPPGCNSGLLQAFGAMDAGAAAGGGAIK